MIQYDCYVAGISEDGKEILKTKLEEHGEVDEVEQADYQKFSNHKCKKTTGLFVFHIRVFEENDGDSVDFYQSLLETILFNNDIDYQCMIVTIICIGDAIWQINN